VVTAPLFECLEEVSREINAGSQLLLGLDFDGTLAPIVSHPAEARMPDETRAVLKVISRTPGVSLAIVSGRELDDLRSKVALEDVILAGNHGLEIAGKDFSWNYPESARWQRLIQEISTELGSRIRAIPGTMVENKRLTATVHYRNAAPADIAGLAEIVHGTVAPRADRFHVRRGKKVLEIFPAVPWNKGSALLWIKERLRDKGSPDASICYAGDDSTDELAFRELPSAVTIRVGKDSHSAARFTVDDTAGVRKFLNWLLSARRSLAAAH
jgi:trehalose 6-phosphate phosphatase